MGVIFPCIIAIYAFDMQFILHVSITYFFATFNLKPFTLEIALSCHCCKDILIQLSMLLKCKLLYYDWNKVRNRFGCRAFIYISITVKLFLFQ